MLLGSNTLYMGCFTAVEVSLGLLELHAVLYEGESNSQQHIIE